MKKLLIVLLSVLFCLTNSAYTQAADKKNVFNTMTKQMQKEITPAMALEKLKKGNERFVSGNMIERDLMSQVKQTAAGQYPIASIVSCLDSRIAPEFVFDQGVGDIFVARIAGNIVNDDILGSLEFGSKLAGSKLIVIMGHSECGAVKGACDGAQLGLLTANLASINPAVENRKHMHELIASKNKEFVQDVAVENVKLQMKELYNRSLVLREMIDSSELKLVGAMYDVATGKVSFFEELGE